MVIEISFAMLTLDYGVHRVGKTMGFIFYNVSGQPFLDNHILFKKKTSIYSVQDRNKITYIIMDECKAQNTHVQND